MEFPAMGLTSEKGTSNISLEATNSVRDTNNPLKRNSNDVGWEFAQLADPANLQKLKCKLCGKVFSGGVSRIKEHIANIKGNAAPCTKSSDEDKAKCKAAIEEARANKKKQTKHAHKVEAREQVTIALDPTDRFTSTIGPGSSSGGNISTNEQKDIVDAHLARWLRECGIPFHAIERDNFKRFVEAIGQFGPGYHPPTSQNLTLREPLLGQDHLLMPPRNDNREPGDGRSLTNRSEERFFGVEKGDSGYYIRVVGWLEEKGLVEASFLTKFLAWYAFKATDQGKMAVKSIVDVMIDDPEELAKQLVHNFSEVIS